MNAVVITDCIVASFHGANNPATFTGASYKTTEREGFGDSFNKLML